ncbi:MAG: hypothetical protein MI802_18155 [Desulfobacterales bacterium]|nr:hypothetical protein [Desulfobacterales bacterium]
MSIQVQSDTTTYAVRVNPGDQISIRYTPDTSSSASQSDAYVYDVDKSAEAKSKAEDLDAVLSMAEMESLRSVYLELGPDHELWESIDTLLTQELTGNDRTNFLAVLGDAEELVMEEFITTVEDLEGEERSLFLSTALRNGGDNLENMVEATQGLTGRRLMNFLNTADSLGRTVDSVKAGELQNFIAAVAESPASLEKITEKVEQLDEEDRAVFLEAAAGAGDELERFLDTADLLAGADLTRFLETAVDAGDGMTNLLTLTQEMTGRGRSEFLNFAAKLTPENTEHFLEATQGVEENVPQLIATTRNLAGTDRDTFLALAADANATLTRFTAVVDKMVETPGVRSDFLNTALKAEGRFEEVVSVAESMGSDLQGEVFSFASGLGYTDLTNFITAADANPSRAATLVDTAEDLSGKERSYLLYAASQSPDNIDDLTNTAGSLRGEELENFLFTAANTAHRNPEGMADYIDKVDDLSGQELEDFLAMERTISAGTDKESLAREYVHLNAVLDEDQMDTLLTAGATMPDFEALVDDFNDMDGAQRDTFLAVADVAGKEILPDLMAVTSKLDEARTEEFMGYARTLGQKSLGDLVKASAQALDKVEAGTSEFGYAIFDKLMETAQGLDYAVDQDFLHAAAAAGDGLEKFIDVTNRIEGFMKTDFLIAADNLADRPNGEFLLDRFTTTTDMLLDKVDEHYLEQKKTGETKAYRPSDLIEDGAFKGRHPLEGYFKSTLFLIGVGVSDSHMNTWFNSWQGLPGNTDEELLI